MRPFRWSTAPDDATPVQKRNFLAVQIDGIGIGLASAAAPFLPVFLTRLGATNFQVGLLTAMPAFTGLFLALLIGRFLQSRRQVVPWYSFMRLLVVLSYALTGIVPFIVPRDYAVQAVLLIWAESEPGQGTAFKFTLPFDHEERVPEGDRLPEAHRAADQTGAVGEEGRV